MGELIESRGFEGYCEEVTSRLKDLLPDGEAFPMYFDQFIAELSALEHFALTGMKFTSRQFGIAHLDFLGDDGRVRAAMDGELAGDLVNLRRIGVLHKSPTHGDWRVTEAGKRAIEVVFSLI